MSGIGRGEVEAFGHPGSDAYTSGSCVAPAAKPTVATFVRTRDKPGRQGTRDLLIEDQEQ